MWCLQLYNSAALCYNNPNHPPLKAHFSLCLTAECKFHCTNGRCLKLLSLICNHLNECGDNSDEEHCPDAVPPPPDTIQCKSIRPLLSQHHICISGRWYCISVGEATVESFSELNAQLTVILEKTVVNYPKEVTLKRVSVCKLKGSWHGKSNLPWYFD